MTRHLSIVALAAVLSLAPSLPVRSASAQQRITSDKSAPPVQLQVVINKFRDDKRVSTMPYTLSARQQGDRGGLGAMLRVGAQVPVASPSSDKTPTVSYRDVGTRIDVQVDGLDDGRFEVTLTVQESAVYLPEPGSPGGSIAIRNSTGAPVLRNYTSTNTLIVKEGQTSQFTAATDPLTGEIIRVELTLTAIK